MEKEVFLSGSDLLSASNKQKDQEECVNRLQGEDSSTVGTALKQEGTMQMLAASVAFYRNRKI